MQPNRRLLMMFVTVAVTDVCAWAETDTPHPVELSGYLENRLLVTVRSDEVTVGDLNRVRIRCSGQVSESSHVAVAVDLYTRYGDFALQLPDSVQQRMATYSMLIGRMVSQSVSIDRAYVDLYFPRFDLSIGKQRVAWGVSYLWSPLDVFNRINLLEPKEEKEGTNAFRIYVPLGQLSSLAAVMVPASQIDEIKSGLRGALTIGLTDIAGSYVYDGTSKAHILGLDAKGERGVGWWLELASIRCDHKHYVKLTVGTDYTFSLKNGLYVLAEYFHNDRGQKHKAQYDFLRLANEATLAQDYLFLTGNYRFTDYTLGACSCVLNLNDGTRVLTPSFQYDLFPNTMLNLGAYVHLGARGGEFRPEGDYRALGYNALFVWLKLDF